MRHLPTGAPLGLLALLATSGCIELELRDPLPLQAGGMAVIAYEGETDQVHIISGDAKAVVTPNKEISSLSLFPCAPERYGLRANMTANTSTASVPLQPNAIYSNGDLDSPHPDPPVVQLGKYVGQKYPSPPRMFGIRTSTDCASNKVVLPRVGVYALGYESPDEDSGIFAGAVTPCTQTVLVREDPEDGTRTQIVVDGRTIKYPVLPFMPPRVLVDVQCGPTPRIAVMTQDTTGSAGMAVVDVMGNVIATTTTALAGAMYALALDPFDSTSVFITMQDDGKETLYQWNTDENQISKDSEDSRAQRLDEDSVVVFRSGGAELHQTSSVDLIEIESDSPRSPVLVDLVARPGHWLFLDDNKVLAVSARGPKKLSYDHDVHVPFELTPSTRLVGLPGLVLVVDTMADVGDRPYRAVGWLSNDLDRRPQDLVDLLQKNN